jgi:hypothetical protein
MRKIIEHISFHIHKYPARMSGYISAIILNMAIYFKNFPTGLLIPTAMLLIVLGEGSQRMEDKKTISALYEMNDPEKKDEQIILEMLKEIHHREQ